MPQEGTGKGKAKGKGKNLVPLQKKKVVANTAGKSISKGAEDSSSTMTWMEGNNDRRGHKLRNMKSVMNKLLGKKNKEKAKTALLPIVGAVMKFHTEEDAPLRTADDVGPTADAATAVAVPIAV